MKDMQNPHRPIPRKTLLEVLLIRCLIPKCLPLELVCLDIKEMAVINRSNDDTF